MFFRFFHRPFFLGVVFLTVMIAALGCGETNSSKTTKESERPSENSLGTCNVCHGNAINAAPPRDTKGNEDLSLQGVGAHQVHLQGTHLSRPVACAECHLVPREVTDAGHIDSELPAEIIFGDLAKSDGLTPSWNGTTCQNTYCHGASLSGGLHTNPVWTKLDGSQTFCGSCHGLPPSFPHPQNTECSKCHSAVMNENREFVDRKLHINGVVDVNPDLPCNACHGFPPPAPHPVDQRCDRCHTDVVNADLTIKNTFLHRNGKIEVKTDFACNDCHGSEENAAPPLDLSGNTDRNSIGVGAHQRHLVEVRWADPVPCNECHLVPSSVYAPGHLDTDGPAEVVFGSLSRVTNLNPQWDRQSCTEVYCHGANLTGGSRSGEPIPWNSFTGFPAACGSCHGLPPSTHDPLRDTNCHNCHSQVAGEQYAIINKSLHMNGRVEVDF